MDEPKDLKRLISFQKDAIVSNTLLKKDTGNITLMAFDKGQELSEHTSPYDAVVYTIEGEIEIRISGIKHSVCKENILLLPAGKPHALKAVKPTKILLTMIKD